MIDSIVNTDCWQVALAVCQMLCQLRWLLASYSGIFAIPGGSN
jgi:hypothetical protein